MLPLRSLFRYSPYDLLPALGGLGHLAFLLITFLAFGRLGWGTAILALVVLAGLTCWNVKCVAHPFIHHPFFRSRRLNRAFGVLESLAIGVPQTLYHHHHHNHHAGESDARGPDGTTRDWASIYRHGQGGKPEPIWRYCLLSFFRLEGRSVVRLCVCQGRAHVAQALVESAGLALFWSVLLAARPGYFLGFYLPAYLLGWALAFAQGYLEHYGGQPGNPFAGAVSSYHRLYNLLTFNAGYHQEHHWDPRTHWTCMPQLRARLAPHLKANRARILRGPHLTALLEDFLERRFGRRKPSTARSRAA